MKRAKYKLVYKLCGKGEKQIVIYEKTGSFFTAYWELNCITVAEWEGKLNDEELLSKALDKLTQIIKNKKINHDWEKNKAQYFDIEGKSL